MGSMECTTYTCSVCGHSYAADEVTASGHSYNAGVVTTNPTCTDEGVKTFTCSACGDTYTEAVDALGELRINAHAFSVFEELIKEHWKDHRTLLGFAMDHGCHEIDDGGSHGLDMPEDLNICHFYQAITGENAK